MAEAHRGAGAALKTETKKRPQPGTPWSGPSFSAGGTWLVLGPAHVRAVERSIPHPLPRGRRFRPPLCIGAPTKTSDLSVGQSGSKPWLAAIAAASRPLAHILALFEDDQRHRSYRPHQECTHSIHSPTCSVKDQMCPIPEKSVLCCNTMILLILRDP